MRFTKSRFNIIVGLLFLMQMSIPSVAQKGDQEMVIPKPGEMVWPAPPEQPRISYQRMITGEDDFKEKKKPSFLDRLMGKKTQEEKIVLTRPYGIAVGQDERIYVADSTQQMIVIFDRQDQSITTWKGNNKIPLSLPLGLALDHNSRLFVSDAKSARVVVFSPEGEPVHSLGADVMVRPAGLAVDTRLRRLYVGDLGLHKILVYDLGTLKLLKQIGGEPGAGDSEPDVLYAPANLALDREGNLFVSDTLECRIIVFNSNGEFVRSFGQRGDGLGEFARPKGIALDSEGHVYVTDAAFGNIQIFSPEGVLLLVVSSGGEPPGYLSLPTGLTIDSQDSIYVAEHWTLESGRLQIFQYLPDKEQPLVTDQAQEIR